MDQSNNEHCSIRIATRALRRRSSVAGLDEVLHSCDDLRRSIDGALNHALGGLPIPRIDLLPQLENGIASLRVAQRRREGLPERREPLRRHVGWSKEGLAGDAAQGQELEYLLRLGIAGELLQQRHIREARIALDRSP